MIKTDVVIVGAGPVGLFQVFELGLLGLQSHLLDSMAQPGGQCVELYPDKPIYDIPGLPVCGAQELIERLQEQIRPFEPQYHLSQTVTQVQVGANGRFEVATSAGTEFDCAAVIIAGGLGAFEPRRLQTHGVTQLEGASLHYRVREPSAFAGKDLVIAGGGDTDRGARSTGRRSRCRSRGGRRCAPPLDAENSSGSGRFYVPGSKDQSGKGHLARVTPRTE